MFLKQINDTVLVTGPFKVNGVPLRRINPAYLIATSTKLSLPSSLDLEKYDVAYFSKEKAPKNKKSEGDFFGDDKKKSAPSSSRIEDQKVVDKAVAAAIKDVTGMRQYLAASFSLSKGDRPHLMKF